MPDGSPKSELDPYLTCLASDDFRANLDHLNTALKTKLSRFSAPLLLNGNLFYDHLQPDFGPDNFDPKSEDKRRRLFEIATRGGTLLEIGVNGGHSLLLAKHANPDLRIIGIDICRQVAPSWARVDLYVPSAMAWLKQRYPGDCTFHVGNSLLEAPRLAVEHPETSLDIVHVDGDKSTYFRDVVNLLPLMHAETVIVLDDSNLKRVRQCVRQLLRAGFVEMHPDFPPETELSYQHVVMRPR